MLNEIKMKLLKIPTPIAGLALGISGLGWCWENAAQLHGYGQLIGAAIAALLLLMLLGKFIFQPGFLWDEVAHPVVGSVLPTIAMTTMIIAKAIASWDLTVAQSVWLFAVVLHISFLILFVYHRAKEFKLHHMVPGWFVPPVGMIVADVAFPGGAFFPVATALLYFGMIAYAILLPLMIYRLIFGAEIPDSAKPTIAILAAPASLSLAGYLTISAAPSLDIVALLVGIAVLMTFVIYVSFFKLLRLPFNPGYAAFTFPLVIGATALFKVAAWMKQRGVESTFINHAHLLALIELAVATIVVSYVAIRYVRFIIKVQAPS